MANKFHGNREGMRNGPLPHGKAPVPTQTKPGPLGKDIKKK